MAYLSCSAPQEAVDTFHAVTGIVWPDLPPWPDASFPDGAAAAAAAANGEQFPEEFRQLQAGPSPTDAMVLEAASWEGTGGQRFLQMRAVAEQVAEQMHMSNRDRVGGSSGGGGGSSTAGATAGRQGGTAANGDAEGPLRRPALGEYVGGCRPNGMLVATVVKAHGRRRRMDDACRVVLRMADWGLKPDVAVFNSLAAAAVWNGRMDLALQVSRSVGRSVMSPRQGKAEVEGGRGI